MKRKGETSKKADEVPKKVNNADELAQLLGVNRVNVFRWLGIKGNPGRLTNGKYNVEAWRKWQIETGRTNVNASENDRGIDDRLKQKRIDKLDVEIRIKLGEYVRIEEVEKAGAQIGENVRNAVMKLQTLAPSLEGRGAVEIAKILSDYSTEEILSHLHLMASKIEELKKPDSEVDEGGNEH